jgi:hypothetical protein
MALLTKRAVKEGGFEKQRKRQQQGGTGQLLAPQQRCWDWLLGLLAFARLRKSR